MTKNKTKLPIEEPSVKNKTSLNKARCISRRNLIFRTVVALNRHLSIKELEEMMHLREYTSKMRKDDIAFFRELGCKIEIRPNRDSPDILEFAYLDGSHIDFDEVRQDQNKSEKALVAKLVASLICAGSSRTDGIEAPDWVHGKEAHNALKQLMVFQPDVAEYSSKVLGVLSKLQEDYKIGNAICSQKHIENLLNSSSSALSARCEKLKFKLHQFWSEKSRLVTIDSGTTNVVLAEFLKQLTFPLPGQGLHSLTVCTNSRKIFEIIGHHTVAIKTIIIGGQQKYRTPTIAGMMAETFLRSVDILRFGMAIIGSTGIDLDGFAICSDSSEESSIKNLLMDKSSLRIVCVDDSKFEYGLGRKSYKFASIDPEHVDLIVTNSPLKSKVASENLSRLETFQAKINLVEARGVPVIVATTRETLDFKRS